MRNQHSNIEIMKTLLTNEKKSNLVGISIVCMGEQNFHLLLNCLESLQEWHPNWRNFSLYVTINEPKEELASKVQTIWPGAKITLTHEKRSYSKNHNENMRVMKEPYVLLLNDDIIFIEDVINKSIEFMIKNEDVGALSPKLLNPDRSLQNSINAKRSLLGAFFMFSKLRKFVKKGDWKWLALKYITKFVGGSSPYIDHNIIQDVWCFAGACEFIKNDQLDKIGLIDEVTQFWGEEAEWHRRILHAGRRVVYFPDAKVIHIGGQSTLFKAAHYKKNRSLNINNNYKIEVNIAVAFISYFEKWHPGIKYQLLRLIIYTSSALRYLLALIKGNQELKNAMLKIMYIVMSPNLVLSGALRHPIPKSNCLK